MKSLCFGNWPMNEIFSSRKQITARVRIWLQSSWCAVIAPAVMATASRKVLTLDERLKVIELAKTNSARQVAKQMGVGKTQIQSILLNKDNIVKECESNVVGSRKRKRKTNSEELEISWTI